MDNANRKIARCEKVKGVNNSLITAMNIEGYSHHKIFIGSVNSERFIEFLEDLFLKLEELNILENSLDYNG